MLLYHQGHFDLAKTNGLVEPRKQHTDSITRLFLPTSVTGCYLMITIGGVIGISAKDYKLYVKGSRVVLV